MHCQNCGFNTDEIYNFCPKCGRKLSVSVSDQVMHFDGNPKIEITAQTIEEPKKVSSKQALTSFIFGIVGCVAYCFCCPSFIFSIVAIILGTRSLNSDKRNFAIAGIILGFIGILIPLVIGLLLLFIESISQSGIFNIY